MFKKNVIRLFSAIVILLPFLSNSQQVTVVSGAMVSAFSPIIRSYDYCAYEVIYLSSEINTTGNIIKFAFERVDGTETSPIDSVSIYFKHTVQTTLATGTYSTAGYNLVYSGVFPNDSGSGWREVVLDSVFAYNGSSNLQVLVTKGYQPAVGNTPISPRWLYATLTPGRARRYYGAVPINVSTSLTATTVTSNVRLEFATVGIVEIIPGTVSVYPNPANDEINFSAGTQMLNSETRLLVSDITGKIISEYVFTNNIAVSVKEFSSGLYFYSVTNKSGSVFYIGSFNVQH